MKCEVYWKNAEGKPIHDENAVEATHLTIGSAMDETSGLLPMIYLVCEEHADIGTRSGWVKITPYVGQVIGQMEQALREGP